MVRYFHFVGYEQPYMILNTDYIHNIIVNHYVHINIYYIFIIKFA